MPAVHTACMLLSLKLRQKYGSLFKLDALVSLSIMYADAPIEIKALGQGDIL